MSLPSFSMRQLIESGVHFGHHPRRWNPKMAPYLFGVRNNVHIINLEKTVPMLYGAMKAVEKVVSGGGRILFVGTKPQASQVIKDSAKRCSQYYVNHRWLGGMMTNWSTVSQSIKRLKEYEETLEEGAQGMTKKEILQLTRSRDKLELAIGGIREMGGVPNMLFVVDTQKEMTAVKEAKKLGIPVVGIVDSNADPGTVDYPIPGNDDAIRSIDCFCNLISGSVLAGLQSQIQAAGVDLGASAELPAQSKKAAPKKAAAKKAEEPKEEKKPAAKKAIAKKAEEPKEEKKPAAKKATAKKAEEPKEEKKPTAKKAPAKKAPAKKAAEKK